MEQEFFDINQLPQEEGVIFLGISMSKIGNTQSAEKCVEYTEQIASKINKTEGVGMVFCYGDYLYFNSEEKAKVLRDRYKELMLSHKSAFLKSLLKNNHWIKKAFSFVTFGQLMLDNNEEYKSSFDVIRNLYQTDTQFKKYVYDDCIEAKSEVSELNILFVLEEITMFYLLAKGRLALTNDFVRDGEWILQAYPGKPLKSEVYLFQVNPLRFSNIKNKYENHFYDLSSQILYDYTKVNIEAL